MSRFITDLHARKLPLDTSADGRSTWQLLQALVYHSDRMGRTITVPAGFITDFASVPRVPIAYLLTAESGHEAAVLHDYLYTTHEVDRADADAVFAEALEVGGEPAWRVWLMWAGVRVGGGASWDAPGPSQPPHVAPVIEAAREAP